MHKEHYWAHWVGYSFSTSSQEAKSHWAWLKPSYESRLLAWIAPCIRWWRCHIRCGLCCWFSWRFRRLRVPKWFQRHLLDHSLAELGASNRLWSRWAFLYLLWRWAPSTVPFGVQLRQKQCRRLLDGSYIVFEPVVCSLLFLASSWRIDLHEGRRLYKHFVVERCNEHADFRCLHFLHPSEANSRSLPVCGRGRRKWSEEIHNLLGALRLLWLLWNPDFSPWRASSPLHFRRTCAHRPCAEAMHVQKLSNLLRLQLQMDRRLQNQHRLLGWSDGWCALHQCKKKPSLLNTWCTMRSFSSVVISPVLRSPMHIALSTRMLMPTCIPISTSYMATHCSISWPFGSCKA